MQVFLERLEIFAGKYFYVEEFILGLGLR